MEFASIILSSILSKSREYLVDSSICQPNCLFRFKNIVEDLKKEEGNLRSIHDRVQQDVEIAKRNTEEIEKDVEKWLMDVQNVLEEIQRLEDDMQVKKTFLCGWCPNWRWRNKLSKRAVKKMSVMLKIQESGKFDRVSHFTTLPGVEGPKDFISFKPTEYAFRRIMEALKNDKINMVGLYGMGGVGKTTLAKVVGKEAKEEKLFDEVVMVTVTQNQNIKNIQGQIAEFLGFEFEGETIEIRAHRLCLRLKEKKTLLILDDVWAKLDLTIIGIPFGDDHKGCTILLTTRQQQVCVSMGCQSWIRLDILNEEEGLILFRKHAGIYNINVSSQWDDVVKEVVGECMGLPIAIVTTGSALREKSIDEWKFVTKKLKMSKLMDIETIDQNVYACLKLSYDYLKAEETKFCFLLCSLFPKDYEIDLEELLRYGLGLDLYGDANSIEEARRQLRVTINNLKSSCLLLDVKEGFVKMHNLVRDVALWITSKGENDFMCKAGMRLTEWPEHQGLEQCTAISLMGNRIEMLPDGLVCPKLKILLLEGNNVEVSNKFFEEMKTLKVASLSWIHLSVKSLRFLTNLVTLQLIHCRLSDISSIKKLAKLEILRLKGSSLVELPKELGELSKLRMLDITDCLFLIRIPINVIPRLSRLEELYIGEDSFKAWEVEGTSAEGSNASLSELSRLYSLSILYLFINVHQRLPKNFVLPTKLFRYDIRVNDDDDDDDEATSGMASYPKSRLLKIRGIEATSLVAFKALCEKSGVEYLKLREIKGCCQNMVPSIDETGLNELKRLSLRSFDELECIVDTTQQQDVAFSNLVDLSIKRVGLREICSGGRPHRGFLENLETLEISSCARMSCLFPSWVLIQSLRKLKKVTVERCDELEDVFQLEGLSYAKENPILLSSLKGLYLDELRNLRYIWKGPTQQISLQSLTIVEVERCNKLRYIFTLSLARSLLQLEQLRVKNCGSLEHIVEIKEVEENVAEGGGNDVIFPKLRKLQLDGLENFISFCSQNYSSTFPALQELNLNLPLNSITSFVANVLQTSNELKKVTVERCDKLEDVFQLEGLSYAKENPILLSSLKGLYLDELRNLRYIWKGPTQQISLQSLTIVEVERCNKLRYIFTLSLARSLLQLEQLRVKNCGSLEHIVEIKEVEENVAEGGGNDVIFPKLRKLQLDGLENFISFCSQNYSSTFPALQELNLNLPLNSITSFVANVLQTSNELKKVTVERCDKLEDVFQLEGLSYAKENPILLSSLKGLYLDELRNLRYIWKGPTQQISLQSLTIVEVERCNKLRYIFTLSLARSLLQLEQLRVKNCGSLEHIVEIKEVEENVAEGGGNDVIFPKLRKLQLDGLENFISFCSQNYSSTFPALQELNLNLPLNSITSFVANVLQTSNELKKVTVERCDKLEDVFQLEGLSYAKENPILLSSLKGLYLDELRNLRYIWKGPTQQISLQSLTIVEVERCNKLRYIFTLSLARSLLQLEQLRVKNCGSLEHIVEIKEVEENVAEGGGNDVIFPKLRKLQLDGLENFISFCSQNYSSTFPALQELNLNLPLNSITSFVANVLQTSNELKKVTVERCDKLEDVFQLEGLSYAKENPILLSSLKGLYLDELRNLRYIWKGPTQQISLQSLTIVEVERCNKLRYIFTLSLARSLLQLEQLRVKNCGSLEHIIEIKEVEENVAEGGGNDVIFPKLRKLQLDGLENFISFCSQNYSSTFPALQELNLNLPLNSITSFVANVLQTSNELKKVTVERCDKLEDVFQLEGLSYAKENPILLSSLKGLYLDELRNLRYIWKGPTQQISLQSLTIVEVERCNKLRYIFTLSLARSLLQLEQLRVKNCGSLEHIVEIKEVEENVAEGGGNDVIFPKLRKLQLDGLENFISFCSQNYSSTFPALQELNLNLTLNSITSFVANVLQTSNELKKVTVERCDKLEDVFQLEGLSYAKENPILLSSLKGLYLDELRNLRYIWKGPTQQISLQSLTIVEVERCNKLRYIFTLSLARSLLQLEQLRVKNCGSLEHIVEIKEVEENVAEGGGNDVTFPKLRKLQLDGLENFINFCSQNYSSTFPALQELSLYLTLNSTTSFVAQLEATVLQTSKEKLRVLEVGISDQLCNTVLAQLKHGFQNLEELKIRDCTVQVLSQLQLSLPSLKVLDLSILKDLECLCKGSRHLLSLPNLKKLSVIYCNRLRHVFSISLARNFMQLEELIIGDCGELEQIFIEESLSPVAFTLLKDHLQSPLFFPNLICWCDHLQLPLLFPNLSSIDIRRCNKLKCMFPVSMAHLLSLQNLTTLKLDTCQGPTHLFSSALARNLLQLESIDISYCKELEQIIVEDHTQDDHVQLGLFPNLSSISVKGCGKLKTLFPAVTIARSGLQKLKTLIVESSSQLEELFGHKDEADMTSDKEMVLPQLEKLILQQLASLINFSHVGYHFIFPSLSRLVVTECPKLTTRFSIDQNRSVHAEAKAPQTGKEDVDMKQSPLETTKEIYGLSFDALQKRLPPYTGK